MFLKPYQDTVFCELLDMAFFGCDTACDLLSCQAPNLPFLPSTATHRHAWASCFQLFDFFFLATNDFDKEAKRLFVQHSFAIFTSAASTLS